MWRTFGYQELLAQTWQTLVVTDNIEAEPWCEGWSYMSRKVPDAERIDGVHWQTASAAEAMSRLATEVGADWMIECTGGRFEATWWHGKDMRQINAATLEGVAHSLAMDMLDVFVKENEK